MAKRQLNSENINDALLSQITANGVKADNAISIANTANLQGVRLGSWNASTNTPTLTADASAVTAGGFYDVTVVGTQSITGTSTVFNVGDRLAKSGSTWYRIPTLDFTKIATWNASSYQIGSQVIYNRKVWQANAITASTDIPNISNKWTSIYDSIKIWDNAATLNPVLVNAILSIELFDVDVSKKYALAVIIRDNAGIVTQLSIYEAIGTGFGTETFRLSNYTPTNTIEQIVIINSVGLTAKITIDFSAIPNSTSITGQNYSVAGISTATYRKKDASIGHVNNILFSQVFNIARKDETIVYANAVTNDNTHASISTINFNLATKKALFNVFKTKGLACSNSSIRYCFLVIRDLTLGTTEVKLADYDGRTTDYIFVLNKSYNQLNVVSVTVGYCDINYIIASQGVNLGVSSSTADTNVSNVALNYLNTSDSIFSTSYITAGGSWRSIPYSVANWDNVIISGIDGFLVSSDSEKGKIQNADVYNILNKNETLAYSNNVTHDTPNNVNAIKFSLVVKSQKFNQISIAGKVSTNTATKYCFVILKDKNGNQEVKVLAYDGRVSDYVFLLGNTYNQKNEIQIVTGYCDTSFNVTSLGTFTGVASTTVDSNSIYPTLSYLNNGVSIFSTSFLATSTAWKSINYKLSFVDNLILGEVKGVDKGISLVLPSKLKALSLSIYWFFDNSFIYNFHKIKSLAYIKTINSLKSSDNSAVSIANIMPTYFTINCSQSTSTTISVSDYGGGVSASVLATKTVNILTTATPSNTTKNVICIGDSYLDNQYGLGILKYLQDFATASSNTINLKGTRLTKYGLASEARESWSETTFLRYVPVSQRVAIQGDATSALMSSPFMFSTDDTVGNAVFSFSQYMSSNSIGSLDAVIIFLGMNGGDGTNLITMINSIKAYNSGIRIIVCCVPACEEKKYNGGSELKQVGRLDQNISYLTKFDGRESENIHVCPTHINFHRVFSLTSTTQQQVQFNEDAIPTEQVDFDHHPSASGARGIAYMMYNYVFI